MIAAYLYVNAFLYALFAAWTTLSLEKTSNAMGYEWLSNGGRSEYLVVYGGMELGFAAFFAYAAWHAQWQRIGLIFALCLYAPIVLYRIVTVMKFWPVRALTLQVATVEVVLLIVAAMLFVRRG
ncbi:MAG: DUF4345 domain-containing protein [Steroidobacteraceae bacterium]